MFWRVSASKVRGRTPSSAKVVTIGSSRAVPDSLPGDVLCGLLGESAPFNRGGGRIAKRAGPLGELRPPYQMMAARGCIGRATSTLIAHQQHRSVDLPLRCRAALPTCCIT